MMAKNLHLYRDQQFAGVWRDLGEVVSIQGSRVLVLGLGDIGTEYALRMYTLGADITGITRTHKEGPPFVQKMAVTEELDQLLPEADIVALSLPGGDGTRGILGEKQIRLMKEGALLLNVGRGNAVDTDALTRALEAGHLRGGRPRRHRPGTAARRPSPLASAPGSDYPACFRRVPYAGCL